MFWLVLRLNWTAAVAHDLERFLASNKIINILDAIEYIT